MLMLYDYFRSSASFRVRIALNLKELPYKKIPVHLVKDEQHAPEFSSINPQHLVPVLQDENRIITQSLAIIDYLDEMYPTPSLFPKDVYQKSLARGFAMMIAADIHPLNNLRVLKYLTQAFELNDDKKNQWYQHWIKSGLTALENKLAGSPLTGEYCFGSEPSVADICLVPQLYNARRFRCDLEAYPTLVRIDAHCQKHSAFKAAWPEEEAVV